MRTGFGSAGQVDASPKNGTLVGYARISTTDQSLDAQIAALTKAGVHPDHIHTDTISGASRRRPGLAMLFKDLREGDTVVVWKLDRFGRSASDLLKHLERLDSMGVRFMSLTESIDTQTPIGKLLFVLLGALAEFERALIAERTRKTMQYNKEHKGAKYGREYLLGDNARSEVARRYEAGAGPTEIAREFGISRGTVVNYIRKAGVKMRPPKLKLAPKKRRGK